MRLFNKGFNCFSEKKTSELFFLDVGMFSPFYATEVVCCKILGLKGNNYVWVCGCVCNTLKYFNNK